MLNSPSEHHKITGNNNQAGGIHINGGSTHIDGDVAGRDMIKTTIIESQTVIVQSKLEEENPLIQPGIDRQPFEPETILIPAGTFLMGSLPAPDIPDYETPQFEVDLPLFRIGKYPVTNEEYATYIHKTGNVVDKTLRWDGNNPPDDQLKHPVTGVTWHDVIAYCQWLAETTERNYQLPSEAQWEKAARGTTGWRYPWGDEWEEQRCHYSLDSFVAVDTFPPQNQYGCFDMVGNCREWTNSLWGKVSKTPDEKYAYPWQDDGRNDVNNPTPLRRVYRGGKTEDVGNMRCTFRGRYFPKLFGPKRNRHGFRIVMLPIN